MKNLKFLVILLFVALITVALQVDVIGQGISQEVKDAGIASVSSAGSSVRFDLRTSSAGGTLTVAAPDGRIFAKEFKSGASPEFLLTDTEGNRLPDGQYAYELRLNPVLSPAQIKSLATSRGKDDDPESVRATRKRAAPSDLVQSGGFSIINGALHVAGAVEGGAQPVSKVTASPTRVPARLTGSPSAAITKIRQHHLSAMLMPDFVIADDLIVQGSACVGLDCVNGEVFGFDTIRMKENNTRLQFDDTSTSAGFPTNNWQIRANSSSSGGQSFLGFLDQGTTGNSETGTIVFEVDAGAPANSLRVSSLGRIGLRTGTPVLDVHVNTSNTPAMRYEQNNTGGFTAQTWDVAGNEANFFVRDVTSGSLLPFRIRPGAPTSSVDISADGDVGIGTASPDFHLHVEGTGIQTIAVESTQNGNNAQFGFFGKTSGGVAQSWLLGENIATTAGNFEIYDNTAAQNRVLITTTGNVGIGTTAPTDLLSVNGTASKPGGGTWAVFSDERLKKIKGNFNSGLKAVMALQPLRYEYKPNNALDIKSPGEHVGFGAQAVQKVLPEAVIRNENGYLSVNSDPILWSMLNAIKEQQQQIVELKKEIRQLRAASRRRR